MRRRRLIKSQVMTHTPITPGQQEAAHGLIENLTHRIEQNYFNTFKNKIKFQDIIPQGLESDLESGTGIDDLHRIVNYPELIREVNLVLLQRRIIYDAVKKYLEQVYDQWADRPY